MENRCGNSWVILKAPARKEKESATIILTMGGNGRRIWKKKKSKKKYYLQASETKPDFLYLLWLQVF